ncbi:hypothetical protein AAG906_035720 [Vitis piasezkii]
MSFNQHNSTLILDMMKGMLFLPGFGLGRCHHGSSEFVTTIDHDTPFGLGFTPTEDDVRYVARLRKDKVKAQLSGIPFDYPIRLYTFNLADYFVRGSKIRPRVEEIGIEDSIVDELQHILHQMQMGDETPNMSTSVMIAPLSSDGANLFSLCFPDETTDYRGTIGPIEGASNSVDPPLSLGILSGFITYSDYYLSISCDDVSLLAPHSPTPHIFDIHDEIAQPNLDIDFFYHDSDPIDWRVSPAIGDVETVDFGIDDQPRELKIGLPLSIDERDTLIHLLKSYLDVFAWLYEDMPGLDLSIIHHHLPILPHAKPVKQKLSVGFILVVKYPECLANIVHDPKKDGKVRVCVDFKDLNKASPKDDFPLPHIDLLVDSTASHSMLSFLDGFSEADHLATLERFFKKIQKFKLKLNPKKYTFGVTSRKLLGHIIKAILDMLVPMTEKKIRVFLGRVLAFSSCFSVSHVGTPLLLYLSISDMALGCMLAQLDDSVKERAIYYLRKRMLEYEMRYIMIEHLCLALYVSHKSIKRRVVVDHLASLPIIKSRPVDDNFPDKEFVAMKILFIVANFIKSHIICRYEVPHELISDRGIHFRAEVETLLQKYGIQHHKSFAYRPRTNGVVEATNKNINKILRKMVETSQDWSKKLHFALWAYCTSFFTSIGVTPYSLVYGMEVVLPVEIEMGSLRVALEQGLIGDPRGKFKPSWRGPYVIRELTPKGAAWLTDLDGNQFLEPTNVDQLKKYYVQDHGRRMGGHHFG